MKEAPLMRTPVDVFYSSKTQFRPNLIVSAEHKDFTFTSTFLLHCVVLPPSYWSDMTLHLTLMFGY